MTGEYNIIYQYGGDNPACRNEKLAFPIVASIALYYYYYTGTTTAADG